jgi:two-component system, OmpR family, phosphate regulon sensor histidine kinase PhoR
VTHTRKLEYMRQDFVANVSHELRTPLTVIRGYLEMLLDETDTRQQRVFNTMMQQTLRMQSVVADLLLLSRLETALPQNKAKQKVAVAGLAKALAVEANMLSGSHSHTVLVDADDKLWLCGREDELRSAFANLIVNAVNYTPAGGRIIIRWYQDEAGAHFSVQDTGIGIPAEHISRVTERFYRVDKARSRDSGGTGLGLAIVKHVLLRHDGKLCIDSTVGKGSTFDCLFAAERVGRG